MLKQRLCHAVKQTLIIIQNLAILLSDKGDFDSAELNSKKVLELQESSLGINDYDTLISVNNLGLFYYNNDVQVDEMCYGLKKISVN